MHDFNCSDPDDMHYPEMANRARYLKENPKGVSEMCKVMEDMRNEAQYRGEVIGSIKAYRKTGMPDEDIIRNVMEDYNVTEQYVRDLMHTAA